MQAEDEEYLQEMYTGPSARNDPDFEFTVLDENSSVEVTKVDDKTSRNPFAYMFEDDEDEECEEENPDGNEDEENNDEVVDNQEEIDREEESDYGADHYGIDSDEERMMGEAIDDNIVPFQERDMESYLECLSICFLRFKGRCINIEDVVSTHTSVIVNMTLDLYTRTVPRM